MRETHIKVYATCTKSTDFENLKLCFLQNFHLETHVYFSVCSPLLSKHLSLDIIFCNVKICCQSFHVGQGI